MRVDHPGHDRQPGAVDALAARSRRRADLDDPTVVHDDVGAGELPRADVDEPVLEDERQLPAAGTADGTRGAPPATVLAMSTTASDSMSRESRCRGNASSSRTFAERTAATSPV